MTEEMYLKYCDDYHLDVSLAEFNKICRELGYNDGSSLGTETTTEHNYMAFFDTNGVVKNDKYSYIATIGVNTLLTPKGVGIPHGYIEFLCDDDNNRLEYVDVRIVRVPRDKKDLSGPTEAAKEMISLLKTPLTRDKLKKWIDKTVKKLLKQCKKEKFEQQFTEDFYSN